MAPGVLGIEASGRVTHADYRDVLIPRADAMTAEGPINILYVIRSDFTGYNLGALWDDGAFAIRHWRDFRRIAVVSDQAWVRAAVTLFKPFMPCEIRLFGRLELSGATTWVSSPRKGDQSA